MWLSSKKDPDRQRMFLYPEALSDDETAPIGLAEAEEALAEESFIEIEEDLYTNVILSMLSPSDNFATRSFSIGLIILVAFLQCVLAFAIYKHVEIAMSWTSMSVKAQSMQELYDDLLHGGRLSYIRLEQADVSSLCGDFEYDLAEKGLPGTNWTAYYEYTKIPVNNWHAWEIPPTDRSELDTARFVLENDEYVCVYIIVTFMWILTIINGLRLISQLLLAITQIPTSKHKGERLLRQDGEDYQILALSYSAKIMGVACVLYRIFISSTITWVGCQFLMWTSTNIELILNALALTFILELDRITYKAAISRARQNLISKLKRLHWRDPTRFARRCVNVSKLTMMVGVLGTSGLITASLRKIQSSAYMDMFTLAAAICLFQGPTPGYWTQYRATFPVPGLCETALQLKCEAPIVGEEGVPCVENWNQLLCKFYVKTDSLFSTWSSIDWINQGACVSYVDGVPHPVHRLDFSGEGQTLQLISEACQAMYQQRPQVEFRSKERESTGPRVRVYPYKEFMPSAPFWCGYREGADAVIKADAPAEVLKWQELLGGCANTTLVYSGNRANLMQSDETAALHAGNFSNETGPFAGVWLSPKMGVVVIENKGREARVTNSLLPLSPVPARVTGHLLKFLKEPHYSCELKDDGKIYISNGEVLVNQKTEMDKTTVKKENRKRAPPWANWFR